MSREAHVRFWEGLGVKFPRATHLVSLILSWAHYISNSSRNPGISGGARRRPLHADVSLESHLRCYNLNVLLFLLVERHTDQCLRLGEIYFLQIYLTQAPIVHRVILHHEVLRIISSRPNG